MCTQGAGAGKGVLGTHVPLLKEQQQTEAERGHPVKLEAPAAHAVSKRPKAGQPGSSVPPEDVHTVQEGDQEVHCLSLQADHVTGSGHMAPHAVHAAALCCLRSSAAS